MIIHAITSETLQDTPFTQ